MKMRLFITPYRPGMLQFPAAVEITGKCLHCKTCNYFGRKISVCFCSISQLLILILKGVVLVSCYFYAIMWLRCEFCTGQMKAQIIFKVMHTAETTVCLSSYWSCHSPLLPPHSQLPQFLFLIRVQDLREVLRRKRTGLEVIGGSLEDSCHLRTCLTSPLSPLMWHIALKKQRSDVPGVPAFFVDTGICHAQVKANSAPDKKAFNLFPLVCVLWLFLKNLI